MKKNFEKKYHELENNHFWYKARRNYILQLLREFPKNSSILDVGCSSGILLNELFAIGFDINNLYGIDISGEAIKNCKENGIINSYKMDAQKINVKKKFDIIIASDCLEHLQYDQKAIKHWYGLLNPGGILLVFVPAFMTLWSEHDEVNMHFRRYTRKELKDKLLLQGFKLVKSGYWNFFLFMPVAIIRFLAKRLRYKKRTGNGDLEEMNFANSLLFNIIKLENKLLNWINLPFGLSAFCIVRKA